MTKRSLATRISVLLVSICLFLAPGAVAQDCGPLTEVIQVGFNETQISNTVNEARDLYSWACSEESTVSERRTSGSINARWGAFRGGAKRGSRSLEEYRQQNCHLAEYTVTNYVESGFRERTIDPAVLDAWQSCQKSRGIDLRPSVYLNQTRVNFTLRSERNPPATLRGMRSEHFTCSAQAGGQDQEITASGINGEWIAISRDEALNVYCVRSSEEQSIGDNVAEVYPADVLSLDLSTGAHSMEFVERRVGPVAEEFKDLQERLKIMRAELDMLKGEVRVQNGIVDLPYADGSRPVVRQRGQSRLRGIVGGREAFPVAFSTVPEVHMALAGADMQNGANVRLQVRVTSVDREGFEYELYSWSDTHVYTASASWIAVVP